MSKVLVVDLMGVSRMSTNGLLTFFASLVCSQWSMHSELVRELITTGGVYFFLVSFLPDSRNSRSWYCAGITPYLVVSSAKTPNNDTSGLMAGYHQHPISYAE